MVNWLSDNIANIIITVLLVALCIWIMRYLRKPGSGCSGCSGSGTCHKCSTTKK